ncbi:uncharacterized protein LOC110693122 [Chenopodium quinoa]|uniref:uncharacterized protein LOC110693122 n=1 Tax=Chenopodium quinoa TaxID=63459 RepID=UPI000B789DAC|nr:uncharacterized protein LOC110693122 [Chenopodium quinoa]
MGGCASRPKDLDINEPVPAEAPAVDKPESDPVAQENNGGEETKTEEPLVGLSETTEEAKESSESTQARELITEVAETKAEEKIEAEEKVEAEAEAEAKEQTEAKVEAAPAEAEAAPTEAAEAAPAEVANTSEIEKIPEPVEEAKVVEAQPSEGKSDAPLVTTEH